MRITHALPAIAAVPAVMLAAFCLSAQDNAAPATDVHANESRGLAPRVPGDYQAQAHAGDVTIAADFDGHSVPTAEQTLTTEDYIIVEAAMFGPAGKHLQISPADFSLHVNKKKQPLPSLSYVVVFSNLRDPEWVSPDEKKKDESKTSINGGGKDPDGNLPPVIHIPIELQRNWQQHTQKAAFPSGDRTLPQAGLLFFQYRGKTKGISSLELLYSGAAGKATLTLQP